MIKWRVFLGSVLFILTVCLSINAHEGHSSPLSIDQSFLFQFFATIGRFHLIFLHFPIALIVMTVVAEWLWIWFGNLMFSHAARFMISAAAIFAPIAALLGLAFGYGQNYEGMSLDLFVWHRYFGLLTAGLAILTAILRERYACQYTSSLKSYYVSLFFLFLSVSLTGAFGGALTFGFDVW